jgi:CspA family cold shock protein
LISLVRAWASDAFFLALSLAKAILGSHISIIDLWPDNRAVSPRIAGRTFRLSPILDEPSFRWRCCVPWLTCIHYSEKDYPMNTGTVKFYNDQKGFGFIQPDNGGKDVFVHATALERGGIRGLRDGQKVVFDTAEDRRSGKIAVNNIQTA